MKLGLIAMSGTRAYNKELTELGLTLPGFVERNKVVASIPSLGLLTIAGMTPADIDIEYIEVPNLAAVDGLPGEYDVVGISSFTAKINDAYQLADRYRKEGVQVILGGLHVTAMPDEAMQHADSVVLGEAELVWPALIDDLKKGQMKPVYDAKGQQFDLAFSPMPRYDLLDVDQYNRITVQTQRGCPFKCEFCASSIVISPTFKVKPVDNVIAEIRHIKQFWPHPFIEFADDNTFANKKHGKKLLRALAGEKIRWFTESDISIAEDEELLQLMRDSGCAQVLIGLESPTAVGLSGVETKTNWKQKQADRYLEAIDRIQSHGITVNGCFVLGLDGTGVDSFDNVFKFVQDSGLFEVQITVQTAFPGTPLYKRLQESGRLIKEGAWDTCTLFDVNYIPDKMSVTDLETNFRKLAERLYSEECTNGRRDRFKERFRQLVAQEHAQSRNH